MHKTLGIDGSDQDGIDLSVKKGDAKPFSSIRTKNVHYFFRRHFSYFPKLHFVRRKDPL
jgi:hypothetical protein